MEKLPVSEYWQRKTELPENNEIQSTPKYPTALTETYYEDLQEKADYKSKDWYLSIYLKKYAMAVRNFYCSVMVAFNNTLYQPIEMPDYAKKSASFMAKDLNTNIPTLEKLAGNLSAVEAELLEGLYRNNTSMEARCNKHKHIKQLRDFAATAWMLYDNLTTDNFYHAIVDFKTRNEDKDMTQDRNIALVSMGHYKTKNFVKTKVNNYFLTSGSRTPFVYKHGSKIRLYQGLNGNDIFTQVIKTFGGYNYEENENNLKSLQAEVTDENAISVIEFYKNYADVKDVYKSVFALIDEIKAGYRVDYVDTNYLLKHGQQRDVYKQAIVYLEQINALLKIAEQNQDYSFIVKDCKHLQNKLQTAVAQIEPYHTKYEEDKIKSREKFKSIISKNEHSI